MKYRSDDIDKILNNLLPKEENRIKSILLNNISSQEGMLSEAIKCMDHAELNNFEPTLQIWNLSGFIMTISMDLKTCMFGILSTQNEWIRRFNLRQSCMIIYESINDLFELIGKKLRDIIDEYFQETVLQIEYNQIRSQLKSFKQQHLERIKEIRNTSTAHKDHEVKNQLSSILNLNLSTNFNMINAFDDILNHLAATTQKLINNDLMRLEKSQK